MARSRNIKPGFYKNEELAECTIWARFIFPGLWMLADREGRLEDRPKRIKGELLPFDGQNVDELLNELKAKGFIVRYANEQGKFIQIIKFREHQSPHYSERQSVIMPPTLPENGSHHDNKTPGVPKASSQKDSQKTTLMMKGAQPPDSLIPDSLIPDCPNPEQAQPKFEPPGIPDPKAAALAEVCTRSKVTLNAKARAHLAQFSAEGLTPTQLEQAIAIARERKPWPEPIAMQYLVPIVMDLRAGNQTARQPTGRDAIPEAMRLIAQREQREASATAQAQSDLLKKIRSGPTTSTPEATQTEKTNPTSSEGFASILSPPDKPQTHSLNAPVQQEAGEIPW